MRKLLIGWALVMCCTMISFAQIRLKGFRQNNIHPRLFTGMWEARWISIPDEQPNAYGVYHFRKSFDLQVVPESFVVHVSADNRYKLYINEQLVSLGPARCDVYNWNFETVDLAPYLKAGRNTLAAVVWNFAEQKPIAQISFNQTGFLLQGNTEAESVVNTDQSWRCIKNKAYAPWSKRVLGYYAAGAGESVDIKDFVWGWEHPQLDDSQWSSAKPGIAGSMKGGRDYPGRMLVPSPIPPMEMNPERLRAVRETNGIKCPKEFLSGKSPVTVPANTTVEILLDNERLITGYLSLLFSKGLDAEINIGYAEALYTPDRKSKGNRNEVEGKTFVGYEDRIIADGSEDRTITTLWWRTWRYIKLVIATKEEPLVLNDIYGTTSYYPFRNETTFSAPGNEYLNQILDIGWHTVLMCANETYMDCPYYEQLQYFGDTRIQAMISMYNTNDRYMVKNALEQGRQSMVADGITMSRYPSGLHQFISSFSLWWICMGHDYWMYRGDEDYLKTLLPAYRNILAWYEQWLKPDHSLGYVPFWFFADWADGFSYGEPVRESEGNSAFQDLMYMITLESTAGMEEAFGNPSMAVHYREIAARLRDSFEQKYWDQSKGLYADAYGHNSFSQHVNSLAVLADVCEGEKAKGVMQKTLEDKSIIQTTIYFKYYLHQALSRAGLGDQFLDQLQEWENQMALGLTTWAEQPEPSRSDCHAWGASPNIEFFRIVLGIGSGAPGFTKIHIQPALGSLKDVSGKMPHPNGFISANYKINKKGALTATLSLPPDTEGVFVWKSKEYPLSSGEQTFTID